MILLPMSMNKQFRHHSSKYALWCCKKTVRHQNVTALTLKHCTSFNY